MARDLTPGKDKRESPARRFLFILGLFMFGVYFVLGLVIIFWKDFPLAIDRTYRVAFGIILIVYSFFRFVRVWKNNLNQFNR